MEDENQNITPAEGTPEAEKPTTETTGTTETTETPAE